MHQPVTGELCADYLCKFEPTQCLATTGLDQPIKMACAASLFYQGSSSKPLESLWPLSR